MRMLQNKKKPALTRQKGSRNLIHNFGLKRFRFNKNAAANNKNTRGKVLPREWPANLQPLLPNARKYSNYAISQLTNEEFNEMTPNEQNFITSVSRFSGPFSETYHRPFFRGDYGPEEAKMMANLTAQYNNPEDMMVAVENLNLNDNVKQQFMLNIASMYRNGRS